jgi:hypothetical protein
VHHFGLLYKYNVKLFFLILINLKAVVP